MPLITPTPDNELERLAETSTTDLDTAIDQAALASPLAAALMRAETAPDRVDKVEESRREEA